MKNKLNIVNAIVNTSVSVLILILSLFESFGEHKHYSRGYTIYGYYIPGDESYYDISMIGTIEFNYFDGVCVVVVLTVLAAIIAFSWLSFAKEYDFSIFNIVFSSIGLFFTIALCIIGCSDGTIYELYGLAYVIMVFEAILVALTVIQRTSYLKSLRV